MAFSNIDYNSTEEIFSVKIEDNTGMLLGRWKFMKKDFPKWAKIMAKKYGISIKIKDISDLSWTDY